MADNLQNYKTKGTPVDYNLDGVKLLIATIIEGVPDKTDYFRGPCGQYWLIVAGYDPETVFSSINRKRDNPYNPLKYCSQCKGNDSILRRLDKIK